MGLMGGRVGSGEAAFCGLREALEREPASVAIVRPGMADEEQDRRTERLGSWFWCRFWSELWQTTRAASAPKTVSPVYISPTLLEHLRYLGTYVRTT